MLCTAGTAATHLSVPLAIKTMSVIIKRPNKLKFVSYNYVGRTYMSVPQTLGHTVSWYFFFTPNNLVVNGLYLLELVKRKLIVLFSGSAVLISSSDPTLGVATLLFS